MFVIKNVPTESEPPFAAYLITWLHMRETERERQRERDRETERQRDRDRKREREREREREEGPRCNGINGSDANWPFCRDRMTILAEFV